MVSRGERVRECGSKGCMWQANGSVDMNEKRINGAVRLQCCSVTVLRSPGNGLIFELSRPM